MLIFGQIWVTVLVMVYSVFPSGKGSSENAVLNPVCSPADYLQVIGKDIGYYLVDLDRGINRSGELSIFFTGCLAPAAPFLLFRLKRTGYSNCRVVSMPAGLLLQANR